MRALPCIYIACKKYFIKIQQRHSNMKSNHQGRCLNRFLFVKQIGQGCWGTVYQAVNTRNNQTVAIKVISKNHFIRTPILEKLVKSEIKILKSCKNQNVTRFIDNFSSHDEIFIVIQYCNEGDLQKYIEKKGRIPEGQAKIFMEQILNGFKGLHQIGAMNRDLKSANILLHNGVCKIADLGFGKQMQKKDSTYTYLGTPLTMAPEILEQMPYSFKADIWSLGIVYYQLLFGRYPYKGQNDLDMLNKIKKSRPDYSGANISDYSRDFIDKCLTVDPQKRINWPQIYGHPLFASNKPYGALRSKIGNNNMDIMAQNRSFYKTHQLHEENLDNITNIYAFESIDNTPQEAIEQDKKEKMMKKLEEQSKRESAYKQYEKNYEKKKNNIIFALLHIIPLVENLTFIDIGSHALSFFIITKKAVLQMRDYLEKIQAKINIFDLNLYFEEFAISPTYEGIVKNIRQVLNILKYQCVCYQNDIEICNQQIKQQFDLSKAVSPDFDGLAMDTGRRYWFLLAQLRQKVQGTNKENLLKALKGIQYWLNSEIDEEKFEQTISELDYRQAEKEIQQKQRVQSALFT